MTAFDRIRTLLEPHCLHLSRVELDCLVQDILLIITAIEAMHEPYTYPDPYALAETEGTA